MAVTYSRQSVIPTAITGPKPVAATIAQVSEEIVIAHLYTKERTHAGKLGTARMFLFDFSVQRYALNRDAEASDEGLPSSAREAYR
jgi:hypothetical protein